MSLFSHLPKPIHGLGAVLRDAPALIIANNHLEADTELNKIDE